MLTKHVHVLVPQAARDLDVFPRLGLGVEDEQHFVGGGGTVYERRRHCADVGKVGGPAVLPSVGQRKGFGRVHTATEGDA